MSGAAPLTDGEHTLTGEPRPLDRALRQLYTGASWAAVRRAVRSGKVRVDDVVIRDPRRPVAPGSHISLRMAAAKYAGPTVGDDVIVHVDPQVVVVRKPAGIVCVPDERWRRGTLAQQVLARLPRRGRRAVPLGIVQRLDRDTSGLLVFTRSREARLSLKRQLQHRAVSRHYLALVAGEAVKTSYRSHLIEHANGKRASTRHRHLGKFACTHVEVVQRLAGATLIRCELETGRTHQIRIHLSEAGHPLLGDQRYARRAIPCPPAPRVMLHAASLGFEQPSTGQPLRFEEPMPADMVEVMERLGR